MIRNKLSLLLILLVVIGLFIRIYNLTNIPKGFHDDELDAGFIGRYILLWGKDIKGNQWPFYYDKLGDFRPTGIFYLSGISTFLFGVNEFAVRFPAALFGSLTVIAIFMLARELFKNSGIAIFSALLLVVSPWHIILSRATTEGIIGLFFILFGIIFLLKYINSRKPSTLVCMIFSFLYCYSFYHSFRLLIPLLFVPFLIVKNKGSTTVRKSLIGTFIFFTFLSIGIGFTPWGKGRFNQVAFFKNPVLQNTIDKQIYAEGPGTGMNILRAHIFHNKIIIYGRELITQYLSYFSPDFLFVSGGFPLRFAVPESGLFYFLTFPLLFIGILVLTRLKTEKFYKYYLVYLLFISPLAAALTYEESPSVSRSLFFIIPLIIIMAIGFESIWKLLSSKYRYIKVILILLLSLESVYFYHQYFIHSPSYKSVLRKEGNREVAKLLIRERNIYDKIIMASAYDIGLYYLFFGKNFSKIDNGIVGFDNKINNIDNIIFTDFECPTLKLDQFKNSGKKMLFIDQGDCKFDGGVRSPFKLVEEVLRKDQTHAFRLLSFEN